MIPHESQQSDMQPSHSGAPTTEENPENTEDLAPAIAPAAPVKTATVTSLFSRADGGGGANSVTLFVSLYLVILAFFIMLVANSTIVKSRHEDAVTSVSQAFSTSADTVYRPLIKEVPPMGQVIALRAYLSPLGDVARQAVSLLNVDVVEQGNTLQITIPVDQLFLPDSSGIRQDQIPFVVRLAQELKKLQANSRIDMEFLISGGRIADKPNATNYLALARAGSMAQTLVDSGVYEESLYTGIIAEDPSNRVTIRFYQRAAEGEQITPTPPIHTEGNPS